MRDVLETTEFFDFGIHQMRLFSLGGKRCEDGACGYEVGEVDEIGFM